MEDREKIVWRQRAHCGNILLEYEWKDYDGAKRVALQIPQPVYRREQYEDIPSRLVYNTLIATLFG